MPPIKIRPTLFVGLGSTGIEIIKEFRRFMFEQFSQGGLPIIGYIGLETDSAADGSDDLFPKEFAINDYENIQVIHLTVQAKKDLQKLSKAQRNEVDRWLDPSLMRADGWAITKGAGSIRMNGRLALWLHSNAVSTTLVNRHGAITSKNAIDDTRNILNNMPLNRFSGSTVEKGYDVYLLGTLCGGTCGGTVIDMAYLVQRLLGIFNVYTPQGMQPADPGIYGVFTIPDAAAAAPENGRKFANAWSSILELDHYMDSETEYDYTIPGQIKRDPVTGSPLSTIQLVSRENLLEKAFFAQDIAKWKGEELNRMVGLRIFNGMFSGLDDEVRAAFIDGTAVGVMSDNVGRNPNLRTKTIISFGISGLWNPLYLYAEAFACKKGQEFCKVWSKDFDQARDMQLANLAQQKWSAIRNNGLNTLMSLPGGKGITNEMGDVFRNAKKLLARQALSQAGSFLSRFPREAPLYDRFNDGGDFRAIMTAQVQNARDIIVSGVKSELDNLIKNMNPFSQKPDDLKNLQELLRFISKFVDMVKMDLGECPQAPPQWTFSPPSFIGAEKLSDNWWLKLLGLARSGIPRAKLIIFDRWKEAVDKHMQLTRNHLVRSIYQEILDHHIENYTTRINNAISNLKDVENELGKNYDQVKNVLDVDIDCIIKMPLYPTLDHHMNHLSELPQLRNAAGMLLDDVRQKWITKEQPPSNQWLDLFSEDDHKVALFIRSSYSPWALKQLASKGIDLPQEALDLYGKPGDSTLLELGKWSFPYLKLIAGTRLAPYNKPVDYICGAGNIQGLGNHIQGRNAHITFNLFVSPLNNMCILFRALPPIYADDIFSADIMKAMYDERSNSNLHTHLKQANEFDKVFAKRRKRIKDRLWAIQALYPYEVFDEVQTVPNKKLYQLSAKEPSDKPIPPYPVNTEADEQKFCEGAAEDSIRGEAILREFNTRIRKLLSDKGNKSVYDRWGQLQQEWTNEVAQERITQEMMNERDKKVSDLYQKVFGN